MTKKNIEEAQKGGVLAQMVATDVNGILTPEERELVDEIWGNILNYEFRGFGRFMILSVLSGIIVCVGVETTFFVVKHTIDFVIHRPFTSALLGVAGWLVYNGTAAKVWNHLVTVNSVIGKLDQYLTQAISVNGTSELNDTPIMTELHLDFIAMEQPNNFEFVNEKPYWRVEKRYKKLKANENLIKNNIKYDRAAAIYKSQRAAARIGKPEQLPPIASFQLTQGQKKLTMHCHNAKSIWSIFMAAIDRQVGTGNMPDLKIIEALHEYVKNEVKSWKLKHIVYKGVKEWLDDHPDWKPSKKTVYREEIARQLKNLYQKGYFKHRFTLMVKNKEMYASFGAYMDQDIIDGISDRARAIMDAIKCMKGVVAWMQQIMFEHMKYNYPEFVHAENSNDFWRRTSRDIKKLFDPIGLSLDGGSHDSHQHKALIQAVDHQMWQWAKPEVLKFLQHFKAENPTKLANDMYKHILLNTKAIIDLKTSKFESLGNIHIDGTVFSGSPTLTTLGNTMRVILCLKFTLVNAGITNYVLRVAGDDAVLWIERADFEAFARQARKFYAPNKDPRRHGLGQVLEWKVGEANEVEFCSKTLMANRAALELGHWVRKPQSLLYKGQRYFGEALDMKDPGIYSATWAQCLSLETQGPVYAEVRALRTIMAKGAMPVEIIKRYNLICKNKEQNYDQHVYYNSISWCLGIPVHKVYWFHMYLRKILKDYYSEIRFGMEISDISSVSMPVVEVGGNHILMTQRKLKEQKAKRAKKENKPRKTVIINAPNTKSRAASKAPDRAKSVRKTALKTAVAQPQQTKNYAAALALLKGLRAADTRRSGLKADSTVTQHGKLWGASNTTEEATKSEVKETSKKGNDGTSGVGWGGPSSSMDAVTTFEMSLTTPGVYDSPFMDESHVCPAPHGIITGNATTSATNNDMLYSVLMLAPALGSAVSKTLADQRAGWAYTQKGSADGITLDNCTGADGSWATTYGNTTAAKKIFAWSGRLDISLRIPEAVVQGTYFTGNAPIATVLSSKVADLIRMSDKTEAELAGKTYRIKSSIVERGIVHNPYGEYSPTGELPQDERVSWIIFSPLSAGTITGTAPATFGINVNPHLHYIWVPTYQPQVASAVQGSVERETSIMFTANQKTHADNIAQSQSVFEQITDAAWDAVTMNHSPYEMMTKAFHKLTSMFNHHRGVGHNGGFGQIAYHDTPLPPIYVSQSQDVEYMLEQVLPRWAPYSSYAPDIENKIKDACTALQALKDSFDEETAKSQAIRDDIEAGKVIFEAKDGLPTKRIIGASGKSLEQLIEELKDTRFERVEPKKFK